ncbi:MAG: ThiF family adenylyltransferase, partial [Patescibacteria group bacterium]|nr:ThiF family adenylyltransferase [Patescibacteria group bacterium]
AGLSVGSAILNTVVRSGGPKNIKIADYDNLEVTNLNRIHAGILDIGLNKTEIAARNCYEIDPFCNLKMYIKGLNANNLSAFILSQPRLNVFIDAMDNFKLKIHARKICKKSRIPVLMATDNGNGVMLDIERFDTEPSRPPFHGRLKQHDLLAADNPNFKGWLNLAIKVIGKENFSAGISRSLPLLGKTISSIPQLGLAANLAGSFTTFALLKLANHEPLPSGRYHVNLDKIID